MRVDVSTCGTVSTIHVWKRLVDNDCLSAWHSWWISERIEAAVCVREGTMSVHSEYKFSVTIHSDDLAVVNCLRALSKFSQKRGNNNIPWGGTKDIDWKRDQHRVTFHFDTSEYRSGFLDEAKRLLPVSLWTVVVQRDDDPATPQ